MKVGIALAWPDETALIGSEVRRLARDADAHGVDSVWTADQLFQFHVTGKPVEAPMLEVYATLSYCAGLHRPVDGGCPRHVRDVPAARAPAQGGQHARRAHRGTGRARPRSRLVRGRGAWARTAVPPRPERFALLEETLQLDLAPPFDLDLAHKIDVLRRHCDDVGRDPNEIEITVLRSADLQERGGVDALLRRAHELAELGPSHLILSARSSSGGRASTASSSSSTSSRPSR